MPTLLYHFQRVSPQVILVLSRGRYHLNCRVKVDVHHVALQCLNDAKNFSSPTIYEIRTQQVSDKIHHPLPMKNAKNQRLGTRTYVRLELFIYALGIQQPKKSQNY